MHSREAARPVHRGADKVLAVRSRDGGPGWDLLDGTDFARTPPCIPLVNDRRNTRPRLMPNCIISEHGYLKVENTDSSDSTGTCGVALVASYPTLA